MEITPYLNFNGNCEAAFRFYETALGGKITFISTWGESPMADQALPGWACKIVHITLEAGACKIHGSDSPGEDYQKPQGISLALGVPSVTEAERVFQALSEGGTVQVPLQETYWTQRFGMLTDRFGIPWLINCEEPVSG